MKQFLVLVTLMCVACVGRTQSLSLEASPLTVPQQFLSQYDSQYTVYAPHGFAVTVYYTGILSGPRFMAFDGDGHLCVADGGASKVYRLLDSNTDGIADTAILIASGTDAAHSIAFHNGQLYAAAPNHTFSFSPNLDGTYGSKQLFIDSVDSAPQGPTNHTTRTILFDDASHSLFMSVGSPCNACREIDTMRGSIVRYDQDGTHPTLYASGMRNAVGLAMDSSHHLWATIAERNNLGQDLPGDLITGIEQEAWYGWPIAFGDHHWDDFSATAEYQAMLPMTKADSLKVASMRVPDITVAAHSTPLGIAYYQDTTLPAQFNNSFFVASHGSYNGVDGRTIANGSKIMIVQKTGSTWSAQDFCTGFLTDSINYLRWARPCGIIIARNGDIFFSSDFASPHSKPAIFRIHSIYGNAVQASASNSSNIDVIQNDGSVLVRSDIPSSIRDIVLYDVIGRTIRVKTSKTSDGLNIDTYGLQRGTYFLSISTSTGTVVKRLIE